MFVKLLYILEVHEVRSVLYWYVPHAATTDVALSPALPISTLLNTSGWVELCSTLGT